MLGRFLHSHGYVLCPAAVNVSKRVQRSLAVRRSRATHIFNHNNNRAEDHKRLQYDLRVRETDGIQNLIGQVHDYLHQRKLIDPRFHRLNDWFCLYSLPGCQQQRLHYDYNPDELNALVEEQHIPLGIIVGVDENPGRLYVSDGQAETLVTYNRGDLLVFRGDLIHAGADYDMYHMRMHCYADSIKHIRDKNRTYYA